MERLIDDDVARGIFRVNRKAMTSPDVVAAERDRIFSSGWNYVGHESEIPNPGDFRRRTVAGRPLIFVRDLAGRVRVFFNTCTHRGAMVCRQDYGNTKAFQCFYHAWTYNTEGEVIGVPDRGSYPDTIDWSMLGLASPALAQGYRGIWFVSYVPQPETLGEYLRRADRPDRSHA